MTSKNVEVSTAKKASAKICLQDQQMDTDINLPANEDEKLQAAKVELFIEEEKKEDTFKPKPKKKKIRKINVSKKSSSAWLERINTVQRKHITPEMRARIKRRAVSQQRNKLHARKCKKMQYRNRAHRNVWANTMQLMERSRASQHENLSSNARTEMLMLSSNAADDNDNLFRLDIGRLGPVRYDRLEVDNSLVLADSIAEQAEEAEEVDVNEMERLLSKLRREPNTDEERKAKFELYETYLETVCEIRKQTFEFWKECKVDFQQDSRDNECAAVKSIEKSLKDIDSEEALGMPDFDGRVWFVYGMCKKAEANNSAIQAVLKMIRTKLELLSHQDECPICLENFDNEHIPQLLACCHKVCDVCWEHWKALRQGRVFCPLCRNDEFVEDVMNMQENFPVVSENAEFI